MNAESPSWLAAAAASRRAQAAKLPSLYRRPKVPPIGRGLVVIGVLGYQIGSWALRERGRPDSRAAISARIRRAAERLGPTYIKLAQIISAGQGVFPAELVAECRKCRDQVPAEPFDVVLAIIESELGRPSSDVFRSIDPTPLAAASIAQVHGAVLHDGQEVVVKVQRPGIDRLVERDLRVLAWLGPLLVGRIPVAALANPPALVELFAETIIEELDFRVEGANMIDIARVLDELGRTEFVVPRPDDRLVTQRILVMERIRGFRFDDVVGMNEAGIDTKAVIRAGMLGFLEGAYLHGLFHGDLHGGNLFVLDDGRTALVDFGITGRLSQTERLAFLRMMMSATTNDVTGQVEALRDLGALPADTDIAAVVNDLGLERPPLDPTQMEPDQMVTELQQMLKGLLAYGARLPKPLMLYVKNLIFIDGAIATLAPDLDLFAVVTDIATYFASQHGAAISAELGRDPDEWQLDLDGIKAGFWVDPTTTHQLTYAEFQERRALINRRMLGRSLD